MPLETSSTITLYLRPSVGYRVPPTRFFDYAGEIVLGRLRSPWANFEEPRKANLQATKGPARKGWNDDDDGGSSLYSEVNHHLSHPSMLLERVKGNLNPFSVVNCLLVMERFHPQQDPPQTTNNVLSNVLSF